MNSAEFTVFDLAAIAVNLAVAYLVVLKEPQPIALLIPILAVTSVITGIIPNRVKSTDQPSAAISDFRTILHLISFVCYAAILLMRFSILEAFGLSIVIGIVTSVFFLITNLILNKL